MSDRVISSLDLSHPEAIGFISPPLYPNFLPPAHPKIWVKFSNPGPCPLARLQRNLTHTAPPRSLRTQSIHSRKPGCTSAVPGLVRMQQGERTCTILMKIKCEGAKISWDESTVILLPEMSWWQVNLSSKNVHYQTPLRPLTRHRC